MTSDSAKLVNWSGTGGLLAGFFGINDSRQICPIRNWWLKQIEHLYLQTSQKKNWGFKKKTLVEMFLHLAYCYVLLFSIHKHPDQEDYNTDNIWRGILWHLLHCSIFLQMRWSHSLWFCKRIHLRYKYKEQHITEYSKHNSDLFQLILTPLSFFFFNENVNAYPSKRSWQQVWMFESVASKADTLKSSTQLSGGTKRIPEKSKWELLS